jgi:hypothetical protein
MFTSNAKGARNCEAGDSIMVNIGTLLGALLDDDKPPVLWLKNYYNIYYSINVYIKVILPY